MVSAASILFTLATGITAVLASLENTNVVRHIDLTRPYLKSTVEIDVTNPDRSSAQSYNYILPKDEYETLADLKVVDSKNNTLDFTLGSEIEQNYQQLVIAFDEPLKKGETETLTVYIFATKSVFPLPEVAKQADLQEVVFESSKNYISEYHTTKEQLQILAPIRQLTDFSEGVSSPDGVPLKADHNNMIRFDAQEDVAPFTEKSLVLRYNFPLSITTVANLDRTISMDTLRNKLYFDESYDLINTGTKLDNDFSRIDYVRNPGAGLNMVALRRLFLHLPADHADEYYVDLVGNVSTSQVHKTMMEVFPRYPLMGGWHYNFTVGWSSELSQYLRHTDNNFILRVPIILGPDRVSITTLNNKIVLPKGAKNIEAYDDMGGVVEFENTNPSLFDLYSNPTVNIRFNHIVTEDRSRQIYVTYQYSVLSRFKLPFTLVTIVATIFYFLKR
ncbi:dolichyl-diphosphooligosaccharide--protein glycotransferase subunit [Starmerella bacillaris]|uniref:Dolichyl-diphosphooligosaccharide--protein glycosyltransferase subunit 1 n=1 Tax=Starmerella bacillaris TaxID=1247836 RepID=A0AAV5RK17_STABA|nr:dolichyl-diphosphooligosaccharide--protein glycotransferase subunit [Starmerella bacillaris]